MKVKIDIILNIPKNEIEIINHTTKNTIMYFPIENFGKNPLGCLDDLFQKLIYYYTYDEVRFQIVRI